MDKTLRNLEEYLKEKILPDLETSRGGFDKVHTLEVVDWLKQIVCHNPELKLDETVLLIAAYAHDWGYSGIFRNGQVMNFEIIENAKKLHMELGAKKVEKLLQDDIFSSLTDEQKVRCVHLVAVHDKKLEIKDVDEIILMEADVLSGLDVNTKKPVLDAESNIKFMESMLNIRIPKFITEFSKKEAKRLIKNREDYFSMNPHKKRKLETVTLIGIDCIDLDRLRLAMDICQQEFEFADVKILSSLKTSQENVVAIKKINSLEEYSKFAISELDNYVETPHVMIVQHDGFILNPKQWTDEFLKYDYIGAPWLVADWSVKNFDFPEELLGKLVVGSGGFSLRSKKLTSLCSKLYKEKKLGRIHPEDTAIGVYNRKLFEDNGINIAPVDVAKKFSFEGETDESNKWNGQFGFHGFKWTDISNWLIEHPEYTLDKERYILKRN